MPSFDIVSEVDLQEVDNAVNQAAKEIGTRYDFKGSKSSLTREEAVVTVISDDEYKLEQVMEVLKGKFVRRKIDPKVIDYSKVEPASGALVRQVLTIKQGIEQELAKKIVKMVKEAKIKVQGAIQGDQVRISGKKRDDLQAAMALVKAADLAQPLQFINFRD